MISAAAAEAIHSPVPLPGMSGVFVEIQHDFDGYNTDRRIPTLNDKDDDIETFETHVVNDTLYISAPWTTLAGVPTLLLPLNPFPYNSPFTLKGKLDKEMGRHVVRGGFRVGAPNAWLLTSIVSLSDYHIKARQFSKPCQANEYHYIDMAKMTWPVLYGPNDVGYEVVLSEQEEVPAYKCKIKLPQIDNKFFDQQVPYETSIWGRGISLSATSGRKVEVKEFHGGAAALFRGIKLHYNVNEEVREFRAFITRDELDFRHVGNAHSLLEAVR
ncbi:hypothetical protein Lser_V15G31554 [Lactuca serriola]